MLLKALSEWILPVQSRNEAKDAWYIYQASLDRDTIWQVYIPAIWMKAEIQVAVLEDLSRLPPRAMSIRELDDLLTTRKDEWEIPERPGNHEIIPVLIENDLLRIAEIASAVYGRKIRYTLGKVSFLQLASSFYKGSYLSHGTALQLRPGLSEPRAISETLNIATLTIGIGSGFQKPAAPIQLHLSLRNTDHNISKWEKHRTSGSHRYARPRERASSSDKP